MPKGCSTVSRRWLNAIYEEDFLGVSYGFRPGRSTHDALDALCVGIHSKKVSFILEADIRSFAVFAPDATRNGNTKLATGGLRDGKPGTSRYREDIRRSPTTLGCSVKYKGVVGKLCGRQCPGVHHDVVRINPLT